MRVKTFFAAVFAAVILTSCAAFPQERIDTYNLKYHRTPLLAVFDGGTRGVFYNTGRELITPGMELPVVRNDAVVALFNVYYVGKMNVWGALETADPIEQLAAGDSVILTTEPYKRPAAGHDATVAPAHIVFAIRNGVTVWCVADRGAIDGFRGGDSAKINAPDGKTDIFVSHYSGRGWTYGVCTSKDRQVESETVFGATLNFGN